MNTLTPSKAPGGRPRRSRMGNFALNLLLVLAGLAVALILAEAALRIHNPFGFRVRGDRIVPPVNFRYSVDNPSLPGVDPHIVHQKNQLGFRGPEYPPHPEKWLKVFAVGGSTTECFFVSDGKDWPSMLAQRLQKVLPRLWLDNAGLDGNSTYGHLILLEDILAALKPQAILFLVGVNEIGNQAGADLDHYYLKKISFSSPKELVRTLATHSEVFSLGYNLYRHFKAIDYGFVHQHLDLAKRGTLEVTPERAARVVAEQDRYLPSYRARLTALVQACQKRGIMPVLITQPLLTGPGRDDVTGADLGLVRLEKGMNGGLMWRVLERYNQVTRDTAAQLGAPLIDLARLMPKSSRYFYDAMHFNNQGCAQVASILAPKLDSLLAPLARQAGSSSASPTKP